MQQRFRRRILILSLLGASALVWVLTRDGNPRMQSEFKSSVDLTPLRAVAVQHDGRLKSLDSFARSILRYISGPHSVHGQSPMFSYLDLMLRPEAYLDADIIYVKKKNVRQKIAQSLAADPAIPRDRLEDFVETGLISPHWLNHSRTLETLEAMEADVIRTARAVGEIHAALSASNPQVLESILRVIPPPGGTPQSPWLPGEKIWNTAAVMPQNNVHARLADLPGASGVPGLPSGLQEQIALTWRSLASAWRAQDAPAAGAAVALLAELLPQVEPELYPSRDTRAWESWYFRNKGLVWTWAVYLLAAVPLLMSVVYRWRPVRIAGLGLFGLAFALHTAALGIRWHLSGRIPNSNMFEAITAATWFGACGALILEYAVRRTALRNLFALGASVCAAVAMMCTHFMPVQLSPEVSNVTPVLHDVWLYIHTNVIIFSYCLIGMAAVTALMYLAYRLMGNGPAFAKAGGMRSLILSDGRAGAFLRRDRVHAGQLLDAATMVLLEFSFVLLWAGIVMGGHVGRSLLGPALGVGPQGRLRPEHLPHLPRAHTRPAQSPRRGALDGRARLRRLRRHALQLDRGELHHHRPAQVRLSSESGMARDRLPPETYPRMSANAAWHGPMARDRATCRTRLTVREASSPIPVTEPDRP